MPGILGIVRFDGQPPVLEAALHKLQHFQTYRSEVIFRSDTMSLGVVMCQGRGPSFDWHYDAQAKTGILVSGTLIAAQPQPHILSASDVLHEYEAYGFRRWPQFEGGFLVIVVDRRKDRLFVANDRLGQVPFYYGNRPGVFAFAPEAKGVLVHDGFEAHFSLSGVINFLSAGYCFGDLTLFEGVSALEPSTLLSVNLSTLATERTRLWKMVYESARDLQRRQAAEDRLFEGILEAHRITLCDAPSRSAVLLSAGLDSRGMLAALERVGQSPGLAVTWGLPQNIPGSDVNLAPRLADAFKVPLLFIPYTSDTFIGNAVTWCYLSELATDNFGWCAQGPEVLAALAKEQPDVLLVGDEVWGISGYVDDEVEARAVVFPASVLAKLKQIFRKSFVKEAQEIYNDAILRITQSCENAEFVDRKDFMYVHGRIPRFLFPIRSQYKKEYALLLRRPFLSNTVLDTVRQLPAKYRIDKNLYISMLRRHFPRAMEVPISTARSTPNWPFDIRRNQALRSYFLELLDFNRLENTLVGEVLDRTQFEQLRDRFFNINIESVPGEVSWLRHWQSPTVFFTKRFPTAASHFPRAVRMVRSMGRRAESWSASTTEEFNILRRIALLSLLHQHLRDFEHV